MNWKFSLAPRRILNLALALAGLGLLVALGFSLNAIFSSRTQQAPQTAGQPEAGKQPSEYVVEQPSATSTLDTSQTELTAGRIAFVRDKNIWVVSPEGDKERQLTRFESEYGVAGDNIFWSPDGTMIAFLLSSKPLERAEPPTAGMLNILDTQSSKIRALQIAASLYAKVVWSGDSRQIAFLDSDDNLVIYDLIVDSQQTVASLAGGSIHLPYTVSLNIGPVYWMENELFYTAASKTSDSFKDTVSLMVYDVESAHGGEVLQLFEAGMYGIESSAGTFISSYSLSNDGDRFAYVTKTDAGFAALRYHDLKTGENRVIYTGNKQCNVISSPNWSPDGDGISFIELCQKDSLLKVLSLTAGEVRVIASTAKFPTSTYAKPTSVNERVVNMFNNGWSPDGSKALYHYRPTSYAVQALLHSVWLVDPKSGIDMKLIDNAYNAVWSSR